MVQPLEVWEWKGNWKFGNGKVISSHILLSMWLLIPAGINKSMLVKGATVHKNIGDCTHSHLCHRSSFFLHDMATASHAGINALPANLILWWWTFFFFFFFDGMDNISHIFNVFFSNQWKCVWYIYFFSWSHVMIMFVLHVFRKFLNTAVCS